VRRREVFAPTNTADLKAAVEVWCKDADAAKEKFGHISEWDTSRITSTSQLFYNQAEFNEDISAWDMSLVADARLMFYQAKEFNQTLGNWDVGRLTTADWMFGHTTFAGAGLESWNTQSLVDARHMFYYSDYFEADLSGWNTTSLIFGQHMFNHALSFNADLSGWDLSSALFLDNTFQYTPEMQFDAGNWKLHVQVAVANTFGRGASDYNIQCEVERPGEKEDGRSPRHTRFYCNDAAKELRDGAVCKPDSKPVCDSGVCRTHCCERNSDEKHTTSSICDKGGQLFEPLGIQDWKPEEHLNAENGWTSTLLTGSSTKLSGLPAGSAVAFAAKYIRDGNKLASGILLQLKWTTDDTIDQKFNVGDNPVGIEWDNPADASPGGVGIDSESGVVYAQPETRGRFTAWLIATNTKGEAAAHGLPSALDQVMLKQWTFAVEDPEVFSIAAEGWKWNPEGRDGVEASEFTDVDVEPNKIYGVGGTYQFAPIKILAAAGEYNGVKFSSILFTILDAPYGLLIDPQDGFIKGTPTKAGKQTMSIAAVDGNGIEVVLQTIAFDVRPGPNGTHCLNGGQIVDDGVGSSFTCDCTNVDYEGANCEVDTFKRQAEEQAAASALEAEEARQEAELKTQEALVSATAAAASAKAAALSAVAATVSAEAAAAAAVAKQEAETEVLVKTQEALAFAQQAAAAAEARQAAEAETLRLTEKALAAAQAAVDALAVAENEKGNAAEAIANAALAFTALEEAVAEKLAAELNATAVKSKAGEDTAAAQAQAAAETAAAQAQAAAETAAARARFVAAQAEAEAEAAAAQAKAEADTAAAHASAAAESKRSMSNTAGAAAGVLVLILLISGTLKYKQHVASLQPVDFRALFEQMIESGEITPEHAKGMHTIQSKAGLLVSHLPREIHRNCIVKNEKIGEGAFGEVFQGVLDEHKYGGVPGYLVACKSVTDSTGEGAHDLLQEATIMAQVGVHANLVSLIGVVTSGTPLLVIIALCSHGSLKAQLEMRALGEGELAGEEGALPPKIDADIALEIAQGMQHLVEHHLVHRDLAARNVLLDAALVCKVADFGLSRAFADDEDHDYYKSTTGMMALRWTAPEAMSTMKFSSKTDVWAFGIVLLEIEINGATPMKELTNAQLVASLQSGYKATKPKQCSDAMYLLMCKCWDLNPALRPTFAELIKMLAEDEFHTHAVKGVAKKKKKKQTRQQSTRGKVGSDNPSYVRGGDGEAEYEINASPEARSAFTSIAMYGTEETVMGFDAVAEADYEMNANRETRAASIASAMYETEETVMGFNLADESNPIKPAAEAVISKKEQHKKKKKKNTKQKLPRMKSKKGARFAKQQAGSTCAYNSSNGQCYATAVAEQPYCTHHTCGMDGCTTSKGSQHSFCDQHDGGERPSTPC
jgi:serine/threonine protein kinase